MKSLENLHFDNSYARLPDPFHCRLAPTPFTSHHLISFNHDAAALIDLDPVEANRPEFIDYLVGNRPLPGADPLAMCYSGHQFGTYVPRLGDGRAILLGQVRNQKGQQWDLHLKGAGPTPYSRGGDGRAVLRSTIREYLCGEAMHGLGIGSSRGLCIIGTRDEVYREDIETGAMLVRMAPSHVRFGNFEYFYYTNQFGHLRRLADHVIAEHFPELLETDAPYLGLLEQAILRTAQLIAHWQAVGFTHGVMNTDNMSILGLTLDYGPYGFLDRFDPGFVCNHSDHAGRYAFDRQPKIGLFNVSCLAQASLPLLSAEPSEAVEKAKAALDKYEPALVQKFSQLMRDKLGLRESRPEDQSLCQDLLDLLAADQVDYTVFFRTLSHFQQDPDDANPVTRNLFQEREAFDRWAERYRQRLRAENSGDMERSERMKRVNPKYILRNYLAQDAIRQAVEQQDYSEIDTLLALLRAPFAENSEMERYAELPPDEAQQIVLSCSS
jgi:uncharacterized protein YdiU (UPF0061 family)